MRALFNALSPRRTARRRGRHVVSLERFEDRQMMSATPFEIALALVESREYCEQAVTEAYEKYLERAPDSAGADYWADRMQAGMTQEQIESSFIGSPEYIANHGGTGAGWVRGMYFDLLGRAPDAAGAQYWEARLNAGAPAAEIALGFAASPERKAMVVQDIYHDYLGRSASGAEVDYWVNAFVHGQRSEQIIAGFVGSDEYVRNHGGMRSGWLNSAYEAVLDRPASAGEATAWLSTSVATSTPATLTDADQMGIYGSARTTPAVANNAPASTSDDDAWFDAWLLGSSISSGNTWSNDSYWENGLYNSYSNLNDPLYWDITSPSATGAWLDRLFTTYGTPSNVNWNDGMFWDIASPSQTGRWLSWLDQQYGDYDHNITPMTSLSLFPIVTGF